MPTEIQNAVETLTKAIKNDSELYYGYQANIAMAFKDEYNRNHKKYKNKEDVHNIANKAAMNFLNMWCNYKDG